MKLYYMYDDSFSDMRDMFIDNIKDSYTAIEIKIESPKFDINTPEDLKFGGGIDIWTSRVKNILSIIEQHQDNEPFIFSDIDIVFYKPTLPTINKLIESKDVLFLRELFDGIHTPQGGNINFGFNVIRSNEKSYRFFNDVLNKVLDTEVWEQMIINNLLYNTNDYDLKWDLLPPTFLSTSVGLHNIDKNIMLYHANCAVKKEEKYNLINIVNKLVSETCV